MQASDEFIKKVKESTAWMDGNGYLHAKPKNNMGEHDKDTLVQGNDFVVNWDPFHEDEKEKEE